MKRLYVLVRTDLRKSQIAVQAGHAVAEHVLTFPNSGWQNTTLIYLGMKNRQQLERWGMKLSRRNIQWTGFIEPDLNDELTAIAAVDDGSMFKKLSLVRL